MLGSAVSIARWKQAAKAVLLDCRVPQTISWLGVPGAVVLRYHSIQRDPQAFATTIGSGITHAASEFEEQMAVVARQFTPVTLDDILRLTRSNHPGIKRGVAITFDDGYRDNWDVAAPILAKHGLRTAFYVTVGCVGALKPPWFCRLRWAFHRTDSRHWVAPDGRLWLLTDAAARHEAFAYASRFCVAHVGASQDERVCAFENELRPAPFPSEDRLMMDWDEIRALRGSGHIVGSHTMTHPNIAHTSPDDALGELRQSKLVLERELESSVIHFSYPSPGLQPNWNERTTAYAKDVGYQTAVTCVSGRVTAADNPLCFRRVTVPHNICEFRWVVEAALAGHCP